MREHSGSHGRRRYQLKKGQRLAAAGPCPARAAGLLTISTSFKRPGVGPYSLAKLPDIKSSALYAMALLRPACRTSALPLGRISGATGSGAVLLMVLAVRLQEGGWGGLLRQAPPCSMIVDQLGRRTGPLLQDLSSPWSGEVARLAGSEGPFPFFVGFLGLTMM